MSKVLDTQIHLFRIEEWMMTLLTLLMAQVVWANPLYDEDNRVGFSQFSLAQKELSKMVAIQIHQGLVHYDATKGLYQLDDQFTGTFKATMTGEEGPAPLCPEERFQDSYNPGFCSGFLVGPDLLLTAGHCLEKKADCQQKVWAFDYVKSGLSLGRNVYRCQEVLKQKIVNDTYGKAQIDYALIRLSQKITDRPWAKLNSKDTLSCRDPLFVLGHPRGIEMVLANQGNMSCRPQDQGPDWFLTNLDSFFGNSGSPVFHERTLEVEGLLAFGAEDYQFDFERSCYKVQRISSSLAQEGVIRSSTLWKELKEFLP